jgi:hypothetical protein
MGLKQPIVDRKLREVCHLFRHSATASRIYVRDLIDIIQKNYRKQSRLMRRDCFCCSFL